MERDNGEERVEGGAKREGAKLILITRHRSYPHLCSNVQAYILAHHPVSYPLFSWRCTHASQPRPLSAPAQHSSNFLAFLSSLPSQPNHHNVSPRTHSASSSDACR